MDFAFRQGKIQSGENETVARVDLRPIVGILSSALNW